jgi:hypothetical protein
MLTRALFCGLLAAALSAVAATVRADDAATAEAVFLAAKTLADDGKWQEACPKFEASYQLDRQLGTLLNLANCLEEIEKRAQAWVRWKEAIEWARRESDDRLAWIEGRHEALVPRLPKVVVVVEHPAADLSVRYGDDDTLLPPASYGVPLVVDPGRVSLRVVRGEAVLDTREVRAEEGKVSEVAVDLAAIARAHPPKAEPPAPAPAVPKPRPERPRAPYDPSQRNAGIVIGAVGLGALLVAGGLEIGALVKKGEADEPDACVNGFCSPQGIEAADEGATLAEAGQWLGIAGLGVLAVGVTVLLTAPSPDDPPPAARLELGPAGLSLRGAF